jgi:UPF0042 nucleotide-binding protein
VAGTGGTRPRKGPGKAEAAPSPRVVIITGLSGSGKTVALRAVEDLNFFCVDNLPVSLIGSLVTRVSRDAKARNIAVGVDIREQEFLRRLDAALSQLRRKHRMEILFLETETDVLIRRFKETRRPHPLGGEIHEAIDAERKGLEALKRNADRIIDTSALSPHQLRKMISGIYLPPAGQKEISVTLVSFGFKYGIPQNIDLLFDVRFLPNPFFVPELKDLTGMDAAVARYVFRQTETADFMKKVKDLLLFLLPRYIREGKSYLTVAVGCTGGRHRSPAIVEKIKTFIRRDDVELNVIHRDIA